jgi:hypothetical protein
MAEIFDKLPNSVSFEIYNEHFIVSWSVKGRGFGEYSFYVEGGKLMCDNECDSRQAVKDVLCMLVDSAKFTDKE